MKPAKECPVQRETARLRSPLASIPPCRRGFSRQRGLPIYRSDLVLWSAEAGPPFRIRRRAECAHHFSDERLLRLEGRVTMRADLSTPSAPAAPELFVRTPQSVVIAWRGCYERVSRVPRPSHAQEQENGPHTRERVGCRRSYRARRSAPNRLRNDCRLEFPEPKRITIKWNMKPGRLAAAKEIGDNIKGMSDLSCPDCESIYIRPSQPPALFAWLFRIFGREPYRCLTCRQRFFLARTPKGKIVTPDGGSEVRSGPPIIASVWRRPTSATAASRAALALRSAEERIRPTLWYLLYVPPLAVVVVCIYLSIPRRPAPLSLMLQGRGTQIRIAWNRDAAVVRDAQSAEIQVDEGGVSRQIDLDRNLLRTGTVVYVRKSNNVVVRMHVGDLEETATFVGPSPPPAEKERVANESDTTGLKLREQAAEIKRLEEIVKHFKEDDRAKENNRIPNNSVATAVLVPGELPGRMPVLPTHNEVASSLSSKPKKADPMPVPRNEPVYRGSEIPTLSPTTARVRPLRPPSNTQSLVLSLAPPQIDTVPAPLTLSSNLIGHPMEPLPAPARAPVRTGTLIWTGQLPKNGILTIDGRRASIGALTGEIPGFPVKVNVHPADLTSDGLRIYTADSKHPPEYIEPPGPHNGWNRTSYLRDQRKANSVTVLEPPHSENGWKRLVLLGGASNLRVVLIEWGAIGNDTSSRVDKHTPIR